MLYFCDFEFLEDGRTIDPISLGIVANDGRELYFEFEFDREKANEFVKENVLPHLTGACSSKTTIKNALLAFMDVEKYGQPELWGNYAAYDHIALCQLFGAMVDLPPGWPMYFHDIQQYAHILGNPQLPDEGKVHHALVDAHWNKDAYGFLRALDLSYQDIKIYNTQCDKKSTIDCGFPYDASTVMNRQNIGLDIYEDTIEKAISFIQKHPDQAGILTEEVNALIIQKVIELEGTIIWGWQPLNVLSEDGSK